jgi:hypothetical protein
MMDRRHMVRTALLLAGLALLYHFAIRYGVHLVNLQAPAWWSGDPRSTFNSYAWLQLTHSIGLLLVSLPFALAIAFLRVARPVPSALLVAFFGSVVPAFVQGGVVPLLLGSSPYTAVSAAIDLLKFASFLPLLTWAVARALPPNNSFKPNPLRGSA